jgi:hypothetical protein
VSIDEKHTWWAKAAQKDSMAALLAKPSYVPGAWMVSAFTLAQ